MVLTQNQIEIPSDNPFANDKFNREIIADNLEQIIDLTEGSFVLSIDSGWGKGKTIFIEMWKRKLDNKEKYVTLYFNAWENDNSDDPLLALIGEIEQVVYKDKLKDTTLTKIKTFGKPLLKQILPNALKIATKGLLDIEKISEFNENQITELVGNLAEVGLSNYKREKEARVKFKEALIQFQKEQSKKVVFFIDELDRCRPTFAIETLERIKHLFYIENFIFVLALDKKQLAYLIQTLYGQNMDSDGYLKRFIDLEYYLPEPNVNIYCDFLMEKHKLKNHNNIFFEQYLKDLIRAYKLSLRDIEKLFFYLKLIVPITDIYKEALDISYQKLIAVIYSFFLVLKIKRNNYYHEFLNKQYDTNKFLNKLELNLVKIEDEVFKNTITIIIAMNLSLNKLNLKKDKLDMQGLEQPVNLNVLIEQGINGAEFIFIKQLQFIDQFNIED